MVGNVGDVGDVRSANREWAREVRERLRAAGFRDGGARGAVLDLLARRDCCSSAQEIFDSLRSDGQRIGIASVYRVLELLARMGLVRRIEIGEVACYEAAHPSGKHHHHLVCDHCGQVTAFEDRGLERAIDRLAVRVDYDVGAHEVVLRGACPTCVAGVPDRPF